MNPVRLISLLVHNDIRIHPQRNATRVFQESLGYELEWYPPHLFRCRIRHDLAQPHGPDNTVYERWFAVTNCEAWDVAKGEKVEIPEQATMNLQLTGIVEISKQISRLLTSMQEQTAAIQQAAALVKGAAPKPAEQPAKAR